MTPLTPCPIVQRASERGSALVGVLLLLMMMSALVAALAVGGQTETLISRNERANAQARAAAEAGLNHAVELATTYIFRWSANGFGSVAGAVDALLVGPDGVSGSEDTDADNGSLGTRAGIDADEDIPLDTKLTITGGILAEYEASLMDDDATAPDENGDPYTDANRTLIIRATGYARDNSEVTVEAMISPIELGALVVNGDLEVVGNVEVSGTAGNVHANGDLDLIGSVDISGYASATGTYTGSEPGTGGAAPVDVPEVDPGDYRHYADFVLTSSGTMTDLNGTVLCAMAPCNNWDWDSSTSTWSTHNAPPTDGTYYVEGSISITGSPGNAKNPIHVTLITEGSIDISGSPDMTADTPELLMVAGGDLEISGGLDAGDPLTAQGQVLVHEQIKFSGNPSIAGQVIVENATSVSTLVTENDLSGNVDIIYNGGLGTANYRVTGWREVR
jgi:hypothetical protein